MNDKTSQDIERTFEIAQRALELMKAYGSSAAPRSYEVWYTYVSGSKPLMNDAIKRISSERGALSEAERTSGSVIGEIDQVMEMIELALGSMAKYGQSLEALSNDFAGPIDRAKVREVIGSLVVATREVATTNQTLDARLKETRGEMESRDARGGAHRIADRPPHR